MNLQVEKMKELTVIMSFITSIITFINLIYENYNILLYVSIICCCITCSISCFLGVKRYSIWKRYLLIRYLFLEESKNKFNIVPKVLLFADVEKKRNEFEVDTLVVEYDLKENNGNVDLNVSWILNDISSVKSNHFYFYTGIDLGIIKNQKFIVTCNKQPETIKLLGDNITNSGNGVFLYHWDIPKNSIKNDGKIDKIALTMDQVNSFDFSKKEVIYFWPWNFAKKINKIKFRISYPASLGKFSMQLLEVGDFLGEKYPFTHSVGTTSIEKFSGNSTGEIFTDEFLLDKKDIHIDNLYYFLLHKMDKMV